jgi:hypothetical protein
VSLAAVAEQRTTAVSIPAPLGGINALDSLVGMSPNEAIRIYNYIPREYGLEVRPGYDEVAHGFTAASTQVRTIIPFHGTVEAGTQDYLFAATQEGIYNITTPIAQESDGYDLTPATALTFTTKTGNAGYCSYTTFTTPGGKYLLVCDEVNGLYIFDPSAPAGVYWRKITRGTSAYPGASPLACIQEDATVTTQIDPTKFVYVTVWKNRVWFIERDSSYVWYLPVSQFVTGASAAAKLIQFGNKFRQGGFMSTLHNYTLDAGSGIDDYLVGVSSMGDVVVYQGFDPDAITSDPASFNLVGVWTIGKVPKGRRYACESGGDLYLLCSYGVLSVGQLLKGIDPGVRPAYITGKITNYLYQDLVAKINQVGWQLTNFESLGIIIISVPKTEVGGVYGQYIMSTSTRAWAQWTGVPMRCMAVWKDSLYIGTDERISGKKGGVYKLTGHSDDEQTEQSGERITSLILMSYQGGESAGANKRIHFIRPYFLSRDRPLFKVRARYDFDIDDYLEVVSGYVDPPNYSIWGTATWGDAQWGEGSNFPYSKLAGAAGMGKFLSIALHTTTHSQTSLVGFVAMVDQGGLL